MGSDLELGLDRICGFIVSSELGFDGELVDVQYRTCGDTSIVTKVLQLYSEMEGTHFVLMGSQWIIFD